MSSSLSISVNNFRKALRAVLPSRGTSTRRSATVLVVDDDPLIVQGIAAILDLEGFTVLTAFDAQSALKLVQKTSPELLISDVNMPGMDGIELAMRLLTALPSMRVLLFSGDFDTLKLNFKHGDTKPLLSYGKAPYRPGRCWSRFAPPSAATSPRAASNHAPPPRKTKRLS